MRSDGISGHPIRPLDRGYRADTFVMCQLVGKGRDTLAPGPMPDRLLLCCRRKPQQADVGPLTANGAFVRSADLGAPSMLRGARTAASGNAALPRITEPKRQLCAGSARRCALAAVSAPGWQPRSAWMPAAGAERTFFATGTNDRKAQITDLRAQPEKTF
jgi:hypothetical protein